MKQVTGASAGQRVGMRVCVRDGRRARELTEASMLTASVMKEKAIC